MFSLAFCLNDRPSPFDFNSPWKLIESNDSLKIYRHPWPHTGIGTFKVETVFNAPMPKILKLITNINSYIFWVPNSLRAEQLSINDYKIVYYLAIEAPWPFSDRDWVNELTIVPGIDEKQITATFKAIDNILPIKKNFIRITEHYASWNLISLDFNRTRSIWQWHTDPGGSIPNWLVEWVARQQVIESLENIRNILKNEP